MHIQCIYYILRLDNEKKTINLIYVEKEWIHKVINKKIEINQMRKGENKDGKTI